MHQFTTSQHHDSVLASPRMKKIILTFLLGLIVATQAQDTGGGNSGNQNSNDSNDTDSQTADAQKKAESEGQRRFWVARVDKSEIMIAVDRLGSISKTEYIVDGKALVHEVVIDMLGGQALTRIYFLEPVTKEMDNGVAKVVDRGMELVERAADRVGTKAQDKVQKNYPQTTHAHTVELRVKSLQDLDVLYASIKDAWVTGKGRVITIK